MFKLYVGASCILQMTTSEILDHTPPRSGPKAWSVVDTDKQETVASYCPIQPRPERFHVKARFARNITRRVA